MSVIRFSDDDGPIDPDTDPNEVFASTVKGVMDLLAEAGFIPVVVCADGSEPCASLDLGDGAWLDITVTYRGADL